MIFRNVALRYGSRRTVFFSETNCSWTVTNTIVFVLQKCCKIVLVSSNTTGWIPRKSCKCGAPRPSVLSPVVVWTCPWRKECYSGDTFSTSHFLKIKKYRKCSFFSHVFHFGGRNSEIEQGFKCERRDLCATKMKHKSHNFSVTMAPWWQHVQTLISPKLIENMFSMKFRKDKSIRHKKMHKVTGSNRTSIRWSSRKSWNVVYSAHLCPVLLLTELASGAKRITLRGTFSTSHFNSNNYPWCALITVFLRFCSVMWILMLDEFSCFPWTSASGTATMIFPISFYSRTVISNQKCVHDAPWTNQSCGVRAGTG